MTQIEFAFQANEMIEKIENVEGLAVGGSWIENELLSSYQFLSSFLNLPFDQ